MSSLNSICATEFCRNSHFFCLDWILQLGGGKRAVRIFSNRGCQTGIVSSTVFGQGPRGGRSAVKTSQINVPSPRKVEHHTQTHFLKVFCNCSELTQAFNALLCPKRGCLQSTIACSFVENVHFVSASLSLFYKCCRLPLTKHSLHCCEPLYVYVSVKSNVLFGGELFRTCLRCSRSLDVPALSTCSDLHCVRTVLYACLEQ